MIVPFPYPSPSEATVAPTGKRVVLVTANGQDIIAGLAFAQPPEVIRPLEDQGVVFSLKRVTPRGYYYTQVMETRMGVLGEFHPAQV